MAGIHGLQHIQGFRPADFSEDNTVGPHPQAVTDEIPLRDFPLSFHIGRSGFQAHHVILTQL
jgi:hypothetical protein